MCCIGVPAVATDRRVSEVIQLQRSLLQLLIVPTLLLMIVSAVLPEHAVGEGLPLPHGALGDHMNKQQLALCRL